MADVVERSARDIGDVFCEGKAGVEDDAEVSNVRGRLEEGTMESDGW